MTVKKNKKPNLKQLSPEVAALLVPILKSLRVLHKPATGTFKAVSERHTEMMDEWADAAARRSKEKA